MAPPYRRLQQYALAISVVSIVYCAAEGAVSIAFGAESASRSLVFFGIQSGIEVTSAAMVLWRFRKVAKPGEERGLTAFSFRFEKIASGSIAALLLILSLATEVSAIVALAKHNEPDGSNASLIISASALVLMVLLWLPKRYLARTLDSSAMQGETQCSLSCIQITIVLFIGSLVYRLWKGGWWVDSATSLLLGFLFGWEGWKMARWVRNPNFDGGCCGDHKCHDSREESTSGRDSPAEQEMKNTRSLCGCCSEKEECRDAEECICSPPLNEKSIPCCVPIGPDGVKCCTYTIPPVRDT
ncbi:hypothetical protein CPB85DRAFT_1219223 [Mucidula mucida]|nr:hypothetical protein CPB85DRAFT_1219223 [Mucidula mucida]